jgi:hypothetical protein
MADMLQKNELSPAELTSSSGSALWKAGLFVIWAVLVLFTIAHHEFWRDEVGALSLAIESPSLWSVPLTIHGESHPAIWYLLLRAAFNLVHATWVLPLVSFLVAALAIWLFLVRAPFAVWWKALFVLSVLPVYEYSVMARNYGISMLLMFAFAAEYAGERYRPLLLGTLLFLLANTNVHSAMLAGVFLTIWFLHRVFTRTPPAQGDTGRFGFTTIAAFALALLGIAACVATIYPTYNDLAYSFSPHWLTRAERAIRVPGLYIDDLLFPMTWPPPIFADTALLFVLALGLLIEPILCAGALAGIWLFALIFAEVYEGELRHQGLLVIFFVSLYWIASVRRRSGAAPEVRWRRAPSYLYAFVLSVVLPLFFALGVVRGAGKIIRDVDHPVSESQAAARLISKDPRLKDAIVIAEPDYVGMSLHYYINNQQYLVRERRFGDSVRFARSSILDLSITDILSRAQRLHQETGKPVLILLSPVLVESAEEQVVAVSYAWHFRYSPRELVQFRAATEHIATLRDAVDADGRDALASGNGNLENYDIYLLNSSVR